jgi:adenosine deaminase
MQVLQTEQDFADLTDSYLARARRAGIRHAEVFLDLQAHTSRGIHPATALSGVRHALATSEQRHDITTGLIVTMLRHLSPSSAMAAYQQTIDAGGPLLGIGLCSSEVGNPASRFTDVFARARADGLHTVAHAGEEGGPSYIWDALNLGVERIDHGIRAIQDEPLMHHLADHQIPLTICPLSNVRLRAVDRLEEHPLATMLRRGLLVSVHSDDPAYFGGYLDDNIDAVQSALNLTADEITQLATNSINSSFATAQRKDLLLSMLRD